MKACAIQLMILLFLSASVSANSDRQKVAINSIKTDLSILTADYYLYLIDPSSFAIYPEGEYKKVDSALSILRALDKTGDSQSKKIAYEWNAYKEIYNLALAGAHDDGFTIDLRLVEKASLIELMLEEYRGRVGIVLTPEELLRRRQSKTLNRIVIEYASANLARIGYSAKEMNQYGDLIKSFNNGWELITKLEGDNYNGSLLKWKFIEAQVSKMRGGKAIPHIVSRYSREISNDLR